MRLVGLLILVGIRAASADHEAIDPGDAAKLLYGKDAAPACTKTSEAIECLLDARYAKDPKARTLAIDLFRATGDVVGLGDDEIMDGGYRGKIHLVPELPVGPYRKHLEWVASAMREIDEFFTKQFDVAAPPSYRWRALAFRFVRSVGKRTPSAYASSWSIEYNVEGSLLISEAGVRETLFHELFHLNDFAHGDWSAKALTVDFDAIVKKCGTKLSCLRPYAPNDTVVRGGTYYAFQQNNGSVVHEYAAELAVRYYKEQSEMRAQGRLSHPAFKCGPPENERAWRTLVTEFFAGQDRVPLCRS